MGIALLRVDERLIHGQVTVGWGSRLHPNRYVVVDDELAGSGWEREIISLGVPSDAQAEFFTVEEARGEIRRWRDSDEVLVLLTRNLSHMVRLAAGGEIEGAEVNLGGIHHATGRHEVLPYLFLDEADRERIRLLEEKGVRVSARDLPSSPRRTTEDLLR